jgi:hypothetical protein
MAFENNFERHNAITIDIKIDDNYLSIIQKESDMKDATKTRMVANANRES